MPASVPKKGPDEKYSNISPGETGLYIGAWIINLGLVCELGITVTIIHVGIARQELYNGVSFYKLAVA